MTWPNPSSWPGTAAPSTSSCPRWRTGRAFVTGATRDRKTVTLQTLAESFSRQGVPVFMADVKGDLTGITQPSSIDAKMAALLKERGIDPVLGGILGGSRRR